MSRLARFPHSRFVGTRDDMVVYDCDDEEQYVVLESREEAEDLGERTLLSSFGPDSLAEARNRGYRSSA